MAPSWLAGPTDSEALAALLDELCRWLHAVFLRYPDGAAVLPQCWLWHPDVVEELLWLMQAWRAAYEGRGGSVQLAGDWHDRQRLGVVRRLKTSVASCSRERHQTRHGWNSAPSGAMPVPGAEAATTIASWWAAARDDAPPEPAAEDTTRPNGAGVSAATNGTGGRARWSR